MDLNIITFTYLFLHLAPFILVCFFALSSLFNQDFKGLVYLVGLLLSCFFTVMFGNILGLEPPSLESPAICSAITIGGASGLSKLPMGQSIFGYTFAYLLYAILSPENNLVNQNYPTLIFFPVLILFDGWWNVNNSCYSAMQLLVSLIIGGISGVIWGSVIDSTKTDSLKYFPGLKNAEVCSKPSSQTFKCRVYKNGKLVG